MVVVGSCEELGEWDIDDGLRLKRDDDDEWRGKLARESAGVIEYKVFI